MSKIILPLAILGFQLFLAACFTPQINANDGLRLKSVFSTNQFSTATASVRTNLTIAVDSPFTISDGQFQILLAATAPDSRATDGIADYSTYDLEGLNLRCPSDVPGFTFGPPQIINAEQAQAVYNGQNYHLLICPYTGNGNNGDFGFGNNNTFQIENLINPQNDPLLDPNPDLFAPIWVRQIDSAGQIIYQQKEGAISTRTVTVTATILPQLTILLEGTPLGENICGRPNDASSSATLVNFGLINNTDFTNASQKLTVTSNISDYVVTNQEDDQMVLRDNNLNPVTTCPLNGQTDDRCLPSSTVFSMSPTNTQPWTSPAQGRGLGLTLENAQGGDSLFDYTQGYRHFADQQNGENPAAIVKQNLLNSSINYFCYRLVATDTNLTGIYQNLITYTVTATF